MHLFPLTVKLSVLRAVLLAAIATSFVPTVADAQSCQPVLSYPRPADALPARYDVQIGIGDFNGDGRPDLFLPSHGSIGEARDYEPTPKLTTVRLLLSTAAGGFTPSTIIIPDHNLDDGASADFNGDGKADLALVGDHEPLVVLFGGGDGTFPTSIAATGALADSVRDAEAGDVTGDGNADLVMSFQGRISVLPGHGDGTFGAAIDSASARGMVRLADMNGDGHVDVVVKNFQTAAILLNNGSGVFTQSWSAALGDGPLALRVADVNSDGRLDVITAEWPRNMSIALGDGAGGLSAPIVLQVSSDYIAGFATGDFDNDGPIDLVVASASGTASFLHGVGDGTFQATNYTLAFPNTLSLAGSGTTVAAFGADQTIRVAPGYAAPTVSAGAPQSLTANLLGYVNATVIGTATGCVSSVSWSEGSTVLGNTATLTTSLGVGTHTLTFTAVTTDGTGSATATIDVQLPTSMGPQGERGERGEKGEKGDKGEQGIQGLQGEKGDKGDQGPQGIQGQTGETGTQGEGLIQGSLLFLPASVAAPAGYTRVGTYTQDVTNLDARGKRVKSEIIVVMWQKD